MLCSTCQSIFKSVDEKSWKVTLAQSVGKHYDTMTELLDTAMMEGCGLCSLLINSLLSDDQTLVELREKSVNDRQGKPLVYRWDAYTRDSYSPSRYQILRFESSDPRLDQREFAAIPTTSIEENDPTSIGYTLESIRGGCTTADIHCLNSIRSSSIWLQACLDEHKDCQKLQYSQMPLADWFPKRLIDLEPEDKTLCIIETSEDVPRGPYATLSHCWGKQPNHFVLTARNLQEMKAQISLETMPPTFSDAISTSRRLGIRYLWIDSLCILQTGKGSAEDWKEHTVAMRDVYSRCIVNISADRAASARDGFLRPYKLDLVSPIIVHHPNSSSYRLVDLDLAHACLSPSPLAKRAWVLQERWLSPRILHFTSQQVFWECRSMPLACEAFPRRVLTATDCDTYSISSVQETVQWSPTMAPFQTDWLKRKDRQGWYQVLEKYSSLMLSFPDKDKFHALAGVVSRVQQEWPDEYVAGLFRSDLPMALLWGIPSDWDGGTSPAVSSHEYRAPSWSWASLDRSVSFSFPKACLDERGRIKYAEVMEATSTLADPENPFGSVHDARLLLRGHVCTARWNVDNPTPTTSGKDMLQLLHTDDSKVLSLIDDIEVALEDTSNYQRLFSDMIVLLIMEAPEARSLKYAGLLLVPEPESGGCRYVRIGVWTSSSAEIEAIFKSKDPKLLTIV